MEESRDLVAISPTEKMVAVGMTQYKNPSLAEAYKHFTGEDLIGAHDAIVDVMATIEVYRHIKGGGSDQ